MNEWMLCNLCSYVCLYVCYIYYIILEDCFATQLIWLCTYIGIRKPISVTNNEKKEDVFSKQANLGLKNQILIGVHSVEML